MSLFEIVCWCVYYACYLKMRQHRWSTEWPEQVKERTRNAENISKETSLSMHHKGYLKASSQKYCKQQTTGSKLRSQALCGPAGKTCHRLCQVQMCSGWYTSPLKRWAAEYSKHVRSWLKKKSCKDSRNLASWGASVYFHWKDLKGRMGWTLDADSKGTGWSLEFRNKSHEIASLPNMIIWEGSPWRNNCWVH